MEGAIADNIGLVEGLGTEKPPFVSSITVPSFGGTKNPYWNYNPNSNTLSHSTDRTQPNFSVTGSFGVSAYGIPPNSAQFFTQGQVVSHIRDTVRGRLEEVGVRLQTRVDETIRRYQSLTVNERNELQGRAREAIESYRSDIAKILESIDEERLRGLLERYSNAQPSSTNTKNLSLPDIAPLIERLHTLESRIRSTIERVQAVLAEYGITDRASLENAIDREVARVIGQREGESVRDTLERIYRERTENTRENREMLEKIANKLGTTLGGVSIGGDIRGKPGIIVRDKDNRIILISQERGLDGKKTYNFTYGYTIESVIDAYARATGRFVAIHHSIHPVTGKAEGTFATPLSSWVSGVLNLDLAGALEDPSTIPDGIDIVFYSHHKKVVLNKSLGKDWWVQIGFTESEFSDIRARALFMKIGMMGELLGGRYTLSLTGSIADFSGNNDASTSIYSGARLSGRWEKSVFRTPNWRSSIDIWGVGRLQTLGVFSKKGVETADITGGTSIRIEYVSSEGKWNIYQLIGNEWLLAPDNVYDKNRLPLQFGRKNIIGIGWEYARTDGSKWGGSATLKHGEYTKTVHGSMMYRLGDGTAFHLGVSEDQHRYSIGELHQRTLSAGMSFPISPRSAIHWHYQNTNYRGIPYRYGSIGFSGAF